MLFDPEKLLLIAGPCSLEDASVTRAAAEALARLQKDRPELRVIFKGSFDKANRTSVESPRGPGLEAGMELFAAVKREHGLPCLTDIHLPEQAASAAETADVLQIPAFLCRQTDLLAAAARTGATINVKKGQFLSPSEMGYVAKKLESAGAKEIWQTERGTTFGYQNLVVDMRSFAMMAEHGHPTVMDATHSVQLPGGAGGVSGGKREYVPTLARAALAAGADGVFLETHPDPDNAISDAASQIPLRDLPALVDSLLRVWEAARANGG